MYYLIYTSYIAEGIQEEILKDLLSKSLEKNKARAVTGMLLYFDEKFIQLIEGEEKEVKQLYQSIFNDARHKNVAILKEGHHENRLFEDWSMGFKAIPPNRFINMEGYKDLNSPNKINTLSALKLFKLLSAETKI